MTVTKQAAGLGLVLLAAALGTLAAPPASAAAPGLALYVPTSADFGSYDRRAQTINASLGEVRVTTSSSLTPFSWVATVSTSGFATGTGTTPQERIPPASVAYRSNPIAIPVGVAVSSCKSDAATATVTLSMQQTAYSCSFLASASPTSLTWRPEISIDVSADNVGGTYAGTITHSVA